MFCALPASGKSETRRYLKSLTSEDTKKFHLGGTSTQVDDFPYVDGMKKIDAAAVEVLGHTIFFNTTDFNLFSDYDWGTLIYLINDDYFDILECNPKIPSKFEKDPVEWLFNRYDVASVKTGHLPARFYDLRQKVGEEKFAEFKKECFDLCNTLLHDKYANIPTSLEGKTIIFEFARGGTKGCDPSKPLTPPFGYEYSLSLFDKRILMNAAILYIWVTPEQSKQKAFQREKEGKEGKSQTVSTQLSLNHGIAETVLDKEYGMDDFDYLLSKSPEKNYVPITRDDVEYKIKAGRLDNRKDLTSDFRKPQNEWTKEQCDNMFNALKSAFDSLLG
jgi:hypothetical protein